MRPGKQVGEFPVTPPSFSPLHVDPDQVGGHCDFGFVISGLRAFWTGGQNRGDQAGKKFRSAPPPAYECDLLVARLVSPHSR